MQPSQRTAIPIAKAMTVMPSILVAAPGRQFQPYIGGGFGEGIHNILEPATYHIPVIFGPEYTKFNEATDLIELKGAFCIQSPEAFEKLVSHLRVAEHRRPIQKIIAAYFDQNRGATKKIITFLNTKNLLH